MRKVPVGISDFEKIRRNGYYYVDKSGLILELLKEEATEVTLITRPRRFGKTLGMSMLASFFDIRRNSRELFAGLEVTRDEAQCEKWMNQFPTIFLSLKDVDGLDFFEAYHMLCAEVADLFRENLYLLESDRIQAYDKEIIRRISEEQASLTDMKRSLVILMRAMKLYYGKPVILLLDEYDVPLAKASRHGYYEPMLEVIKGMMSTSLKDNPALRFAIITGCLKIAKESIFTGTNNFASDTITDSRLNEYFGFTEEEVKHILEEAGAVQNMAQVKEWYDGYHFGNTDVYCPWDVMNYIRDLGKNPQAKPTGYWQNTSDNSVIRSFIDYAGSSITGKLETLLSGGYILQTIDENLTYDYLHSSENNLWSVLYLTGYLTRAAEADTKADALSGREALMIPNREIREIFEHTIVDWFDDSAKQWNRSELFDAVWNADCDKITQEMNRLLRRTISYHDYREDFYHAFLTGIFTGAGYMVESNKEHGEGRSDVVVSDSIHGRIAVFEIKYSGKAERMEADCGRALAQIQERRYAMDYEEQYENVLCYGITFFRKRCLVKIK